MVRKQRLRECLLPGKTFRQTHYDGELVHVSSMSARYQVQMHVKRILLSSHAPCKSPSQVLACSVSGSGWLGPQMRHILNVRGGGHEQEREVLPVELSARASSPCCLAGHRGRRAWTRSWAVMQLAGEHPLLSSLHRPSFIWPSPDAKDTEQKLLEDLVRRERAERTALAIQSPGPPARVWAAAPQLSLFQPAWELGAPALVWLLPRQQHLLAMNEDGVVAAGLAVGQEEGLFAHTDKTTGPLEASTPAGPTHS